MVYMGAKKQVSLYLIRVLKGCLNKKGDLTPYENISFSYFK